MQNNKANTINTADFFIVIFILVYYNKNPQKIRGFSFFFIFLFLPLRCTQNMLKYIHYYEF